MTFKIKFLLVTLGLYLVIPNGRLYSQKIPTEQKTQQEAQLPFDKEVIVGKLPNGFTYYIRKNVEPANRAVFYLVNKVGSILEEENELGLAHFLEHMAFNGTKHYPKNELVSYLQKMGVKFGADLNAYTGFDETVYQLPIPSDKPENISSAIQIMRDWAQDIAMEEDEIEAERGVILEEKRLRKGVQDRVQNLTLPILLNHSRYAKRFPIGTEEVLTTFKPEVIQGFYEKWYRPDLQALIVVGDIDVQDIEQQIKAKFSDLVAPKEAPERSTYTVSLTDKNSFTEITDPEIGGTSLQLVIKQPGTEFKTETDIRNYLVTTLFNSMLNARITEVGKQENPPFMNGQAGFGNLMAGLSAINLVVATKPNELEKGFKAVLTEVERVRQSGFTQTEMDRIKQSFINEQDHSYGERYKTQSATYAKEYVQVFLKDKASPGIDYLYNYYKKNISNISLEEVNALISKFDFSVNRDIFIVAPEREKDNLPKEDTVLAWISDIQQENLTTYEDGDYSGSMVENLPVAGKVIKETIRKEVGITEWQLSNGVKVILKPTDFKHDQIIFSSYSPGGTSLYPDSDFHSAINAPSIVAGSGIGKYDSKTLPKVLSGKLSKVTPYISDRYEGINGISSIKDLETTMQLIYLYFTESRLDDAVIKGALGNAKSSILNRYNNPENVFADTVQAIMGNYHYRNLPPSLEKINQINPERSLEIFKDRFADASDFTFVFTGSLNVDSLKPLIEQYLGALPSINRKEQGKDLGIRIPEGQIEKTIYKGKEHKANVRLVLSGKYKYNEANHWNMKALQEILNIKLIERLREKEGGVYTSGVNIKYDNFPKPNYLVSISFGCAPENVDKLIQATKDEMEQLIKNGPTAVDIEKFKAEESRAIELAIKSNEYWHGNLVKRYQNNENPAEILKNMKHVKNITVKSVQKVAKDYLNTNNVIQFVLLPEELEK
ncbi:insulinase family protein [Sphingobacterium sp. C459-1T]|uniref:Insulinase family protein n=2 Tax=Sphingobacterium faecale TaxID=2803775 RepID=A0ABS1R192_9SPHI|nr:insulinase family protein [Sphingobacterium faecale]